MQPTSVRLNSLRQDMIRQNIQGFLIFHEDEHMGETGALYSERLAWLTGFTGSAGMAVVTHEKAAVFSDGRYTEQMKIQTDPKYWETKHLFDTPPADWLKQNLKIGDIIGYDPRVVSEILLSPFVKAGLILQPVPQNPIDMLWTDQPPRPNYRLEIQTICLAGQEHKDKQMHIGDLMKNAGVDTILLCDPTSIAWLLNIRGRDIPHTPVALAFFLMQQNGHGTLFLHDTRAAECIRCHLGDKIKVRDYSYLQSALQNCRNQTVWIDPATTALYFIQALEKAEASIIRKSDPCVLLKAIKNKTEQDGARQAHIRDGVAMCRFLHWLEQNAIGQTESEVSDYLLRLRADDPNFVELSFPTIVGSGPNSAIIHYQPSPQSSRTIRANEILLIDSGGQYPLGTTDITRTVWTGPDAVPDEIRQAVTRVMKGHIRLALARFPEGTTGEKLDSLARYDLWQDYKDYDHGTGHGVGSYLSVHEGPCRISLRPSYCALQAGMILSNEPGVYLPNKFGVRIENLVLVRPCSEKFLGKRFMELETLTLVPFDRRLLMISMLTNAEKGWINFYHSHVFELLNDKLCGDALRWLKRTCNPL